MCYFCSCRTLMFGTGTTIRRSLLVPLFALQAPSSTVSWIKGDYGQWIAFVGILLRLFCYVPGELELPLSTILLVMTAPYQFMDLRVSRRCYTLRGNSDLSHVSTF
ncbi:hypothetical protein PVAP13_5KG421700 [Panicum virgatum]|uniref:Uncharacterized protein n=1 Tax=Panicum virgatum TaxID=38727 RepID=A0A8T0SU13_PANVG|nr:hypothetical protein PVAP13_5KG421700 [Panicum virgatum]